MNRRRPTALNSALFVIKTNVQIIIVYSHLSIYRWAGAISLPRPLAPSPPRPLLFSQTYHNVQKEEIPSWANRKISNASNLTTKLLTPPQSLFSNFVEMSTLCTICAVSANSNSDDSVLTAVFPVLVQLFFAERCPPAAAAATAALWLSGKLLLIRGSCRW